MYVNSKFYQQNRKHFPKLNFFFYIIQYFKLSLELKSNDLSSYFFYKIKTLLQILFTCFQVYEK